MADQIEHLSKPVKLPCGVELPNGLAKAAMAESMASSKDLTVPNQRFPGVYSAWADGEWGMILSGNVQVDPAYLGTPKDLTIDHSRLNDPKYVEAWAKYATASQKQGTPTMVQINHPGRQSPVGAGTRGFFGTTVAPSVVPLSFGPGMLANLLRKFVFGTPKALTVKEIGDVVDKFVNTAVLCYEAGFKGVEIHAAHGYLLAQFLSPKTNLRTDKYGGNATQRAAIVVEIIRAIRKATPPSFCVGIKLNSADVQIGDSIDDTMTQIRNIVDAGIDFLEISGGTYEKPTMMLGHAKAPSERTQKREAFFLDFAHQVREKFPKTVLMVTGGFRTREGMANALASGACDVVGIGRPAAGHPHLPRDLLLNPNIPTDQAVIRLPPPKKWSLLNALGIGFVGAGIESEVYASQIRALVNYVGSLVSGKSKKVV